MQQQPQQQQKPKHQKWAKHIAQKPQLGYLSKTICAYCSNSSWQHVSSGYFLGSGAPDETDPMRQLQHRLYCKARHAYIVTEHFIKDKNGNWISSPVQLECCTDFDKVIDDD